VRESRLTLATASESDPRIGGICGVKIKLEAHDGGDEPGSTACSSNRVEGKRSTKMPK
jgi:hypothetical protein